MKNLNTRPWSTPVTMGAGIFVVITGLLMFFVTESPFKFAHELVGIGFSVAVVLHVLTHWRSFSNYFAQRRAVGVLALAGSAGIGLVMASAILGTGEPEELILERIDSARVDVLAPAIGMDVSELIERLGKDGIVVDDPGMSIRQLAVRYGAETDDVLLSVLQGRIPDFPVTRSHPSASWRPSAANSSICRTYRKTAGEESRRRSPVANRWMRP